MIISHSETPNITWVGAPLKNLIKSTHDRCATSNLSSNRQTLRVSFFHSTQRGKIDSTYQRIELAPATHLQECITIEDFH